jgi:hypothetical protein
MMLYKFTGKLEQRENPVILKDQDGRSIDWVETTDDKKVWEKGLKEITKENSNEGILF